MAKFIYKMQNILDIKNKLETQEKTAFAIEVQKLRTEEERLEQEEKEQEALFNRLARIPGASVVK